MGFQEAFAVVTDMVIPAWGQLPLSISAPLNRVPGRNDILTRLWREKRRIRDDILR